MRLPLPAVGFVLSLLLACGGSTAAVPGADGGAPSGDDAGAAGPCTAGQTITCFGGGLSDHVCGDSGIQVACSGGQFVCPAGTIPESECWCSAIGSCGPGLGPVGTCTPTGWSCEPLDAAAEAAPVTCHGACPQPNGASCQSDCDCYNKCLGGICADPTHPAIPCTGDASGCPAAQTCALSGTCEGAACASSDECPPQQQCSAQRCQFFGCI